MKTSVSCATIAAEAQRVVAELVRSVPEPHVGVVHAQQAQFMEQIKELQRVSNLQEISSQEWRAQAEADSPTRGKGNCLGLSPEVINKLNDYFSVTDTVSIQEAGILGAQLGTSAEMVRSFLYQNQAHVEQVLEGARLKFLISSKVSKPKQSVVEEPVSQPSPPDPLASSEIHGHLQSEQASWSAHQGYSVVKTDHSSPLHQPDREGSGDISGRVGTKRSRQRSSGVSAVPGGGTMEQTISSDDIEKINRLHGLMSSMGGLKDAGSAGSVLLVMREETSFPVREALLDAVLKTHHDALLDRLLNHMFFGIMENWITEGTKQRKTQFLKQIVAVLEHLPLKTDHVKNSRLQTLATRLANKYHDPELRISAAELVNRFQSLRQGLSPGGQGRGHHLGTVLERLQSGEARQKGKVFFLPGDEMKRPGKKKQSVKQRPLTTSEIIERQQRMRYLNQARFPPENQSWRSAEDSPEAGRTSVTPGAFTSASDHNDLVPDTLEALQQHQEEKKWKQEPLKVKPKPVRVSTATAQQSASGTLVRWMREAPSDPSFYSFQQQIYHSARYCRIAEELQAAEQDSRQIGRMRASGRWVRPPRVQFSYTPLALGEASTERQTLPAQERPLHHNSQVLLDTPQEPPGAPLVDTPRPQELPFAPLNKEEQEDQRRKLLLKGVRKQEFVQTPFDSLQYCRQGHQVHQSASRHALKLDVPQMPTMVHQVPAGVISGRVTQQIPLGALSNPGPLLQGQQRIIGQVINQHNGGNLSGQHPSQGWSNMGNRW